jgi:membrane-associated phospholipid phosphatase
MKYKKLEYNELEYNNLLEKIFLKGGFYMPNICLTIGIFYLFINKGNVLKFITFYILCVLLNTTLKLYIKEPRPIKSTDYGGIPGNSYGMPSGHAQSVSFSILYLYLLYPKNIFLFILSIIAISITSLQRIQCYRHTPKQVYSGVIVGGILAFILANIKVNILE